MPHARGEAEHWHTPGAQQTVGPGTGPFPHETISSPALKHALETHLESPAAPLATAAQANGLVLVHYLEANSLLPFALYWGYPEISPPPTPPKL